MCYGEVLLVTNRTFIEFRWPEEERVSLRRTKSEPCLTCDSVTPSAKGLSKLIMEAATPTTCASVNGDDDRDSVSFSDEFLEDEIVSNACFIISSDCSNRWADITDFGTMSLESKPSGDQRKEGKEFKRLSGRARQREKRRQRMRTPSPSRR
jgi:hypothetical protein